MRRSVPDGAPRGRPSLAAWPLCDGRAGRHGGVTEPSRSRHGAVTEKSRSRHGVVTEKSRSRHGEVTESSRNRGDAVTRSRMSGTVPWRRSVARVMGSMGSQTDVAGVVGGPATSAAVA